MSRILLLVPRMNIGGAETYVYSVAKELHNRGKHEVFVASGGGKFADKLEELGVKTVFLPVRFNRALAVFLLKRIIKKYKIDLVHANSGDAGVVAYNQSVAAGTEVSPGASITVHFHTTTQAAD